MSRNYNVLVDEPKNFVVLYEEEYPVFTSFKNWIKISLLLENGGLENPEKLAKMLKLCYSEKLPPNVGSAVLGMLSFLNGDTDFSVSSNKKKTEKLYSFKEDSDAIYASFYAKYKIDLEKCDMHWYKFCALFNGLADDNPFNTLLKIRTTDETKIKDLVKRRKVKELKTKYGIKANVEIDVAENISSLF